MGVSSETLRSTGFIQGLSSTGETKMDAVAGLLSCLPSETLKVKLSLPKKLACGS